MQASHLLRSWVLAKRGAPFRLEVRLLPGQQGRRCLTEPEPYRYCVFADYRLHRVVEGETLLDLAERYFVPLPRARGFWWAIADFQPGPIVDPTLALEEGKTEVIPSTRVLTDVILAAGGRMNPALLPSRFG